MAGQGAGKGTRGVAKAGGSGKPEQHGVLDPISLEGTSEADKRLDFALERSLRDAGSYESSQEATIRQEVRLPLFKPPLLLCL